MSFRLQQSEDAVLNFTVENEDTGNAIDLSNKEVSFLVAKSLESDSALLDVDATGESSDGTCKVTLTSTQTDQEIDNYFYQLKIVDSTSGNVNFTKPDKFYIGKNVKK